MAVHFIHNIQRIPITTEEAWTFFSTPANLSAITPDNMNFHILSGNATTTLYEGQVFEYKVSPLLHIPLYWKSLITTVEAPYRFLDRQLKGPYKRWEHQHNFKPIDGGVEMTDQITYEIPLGFLGEIANGLFVKQRLRGIFEFRYRKIEALLGAWPGGNCQVTIH